jgi:hypothetical protein
MTNVDLRRVYDYGIGGFGRRFFWYRNSPDDQPVPPDADAPMSMQECCHHWCAAAVCIRSLVV